MPSCGTTGSGMAMPRTSSNPHLASVQDFDGQDLPGSVHYLMSIKFLITLTRVKLSTRF
ncbi:hypothetical protein FB388_1089 [Pseudonocardia cypriaca]|uniref:Uncharacterized protein n=1 Tax=Pseudonocardia cypriaca TaxID=882449 RepID=A0A543GCC7_9PSEU|nr:hypothetical protein FB388_1089 [Pseudonocardia cypriaca]